MIMMWDISWIWTAWLIPHSITKSSASIKVILIAWWVVFAVILLSDQICKIDIVMLFLILALEMTITMLESDRASSEILSSLQRWASLLSLSLQPTVWKEKWLGKLSTSLNPDESSLWRGLKDRKILLR